VISITIVGIESDTLFIINPFSKNEKERKDERKQHILLKSNPIHHIDAGTTHKSPNPIY